MITISSTWMCGDTTARTAVLLPDGWVASWLPDRTLTRDEAITAMTLAELVADGGPGHLVRHYAAELDVPAADAIRLINGRPRQFHDSHAIGDDGPDFTTESPF